MAADPQVIALPARTEFDTLLHQHSRRVYAFVARYVGPEHAEDACQEVWLAVYRALPSYRGRAAVTTWLFAVAARVCHKLRRRKRLATVDEALAGELPSPDPDPEHRLLGRELAEVVREAIDRLPPGIRETVHLRQIEGYAYAEIADILAIPVGTVRSRLHHGMSKLADLLSPYLETHDAER